MKRITMTALIGTSLVFVAGCVTHHRRAHDGWTRWEKSAGGNGHWYKAVAVTNGISWAEADKLARVEGGYLATITSAVENDFIFSLVNSPRFFRDFNGGGPLLGGSQREGAQEPDGGWGWVTGEQWSYTHWFPGQPNNYPGGPDAPRPEDKLHFFSGTGRAAASTWNDLTANDTNTGGYVIERDK